MGKESWETTSGLLDDFTLNVAEAWFGEDEENDDERIYLFLRGLATDSDDGEESEDYRERFRVGTNWEVVDKGGAVENATGKPKFNKNSGVGRLIRSMVADQATADALAEKHGAAVLCPEDPAYPPALGEYRARSSRQDWRDCFAREPEGPGDDPGQRETRHG